MKQLAESSLFAIALCILAYELGIWIQIKLKTPLANPLLLAIIIVILFLKLFNVPFESFNNGGSFISMFLAPATASLAISIYKQFDTLKKNLLPVIVGTAVGSAISITSVILLCKLFKLDELIMHSLIPKSVTTPIAIEISMQYGGIVPVTVSAVIITGIMGAIFSPLFVKLFRVKNPVVVGIAIGTSSHALGTAKAIELGEIQGMMSGISIGVAGIITVLYAMFIK